MKHEEFPVEGFGFMNEPATDEQKQIIIELATRIGYNMSPDSLTNLNAWPKAFSKWDAKNMIDALREQLGEQTIDGSCDCPPCSKRREKTKAELQTASDHKPTIGIILSDCEPCETFCHACGQLRLWVGPEKPTACGNCGSANIEIGQVNSDHLEHLRTTYIPPTQRNS